MKNRFFYFFCLINLTAFTLNQAFGQTTWYVNKNASGSNDGTSLDNGWTHFSSINWNNIKSGDKLIIADGVYNEQLQIVNGQQNITISGTNKSNVILDGQNSIGDGIFIDGKTKPVDYVTIKNLTFRNFTWAGIYSDGEYTGRVSNLTVNSCIFYDNIRSCIFYEGGDNVTNNYNFVIKNCYMNTPDNNDEQTDLIYTQYINDVTVDNCYLMVDNVAVAGHNDCFQSNDVNNCTLINNIAIQNNSKTSETQCLFVAGGNGTHIFYNNVVYDDCNGNATDSKLIYMGPSNGGARAIFLNNTVYAHGPGLIDTSDPNSIIENNILYNTDHTVAYTPSMIRFEHGQGSGAVCDYNLYFNAVEVVIPPGFSIGPHSIIKDPLFTNIGTPTSFDLTIKSNSPTIKAGTNLTSYLAKDITGRLRPATGPWDMGAYLHDSIADTQPGQVNNPSSFILFQNYPNPFNPSTTIEYKVPLGANIKIKIFDLRGKEITTLVDEFKPEGTYSINFNASNLASGIYFYELISNNYTQTKKMILLK